MQRFKNILAHINLTVEEHPALERGIRLARQNCATLTAMSVIEEHPTIVHAWRAYEEGKLKRHMEPNQFEEYLSRWSQESSKRAWNFVSSSGRDIKPNSIHLIHGGPGFVMPKFAKDHDIDLVVMGTLGRLGQHGMFITDTAERILNRLECSVLAVKPAGIVSPVQ